MKIYLAGGYVRDTLLGLKPKDRDYVVVGSTPEEMLSLGYQQVGADFPVFLKDGEEYALARTERKTGKGYAGFEVDASPIVTLKEDASRRDLTINSMFMDIETGEIIDYFGGQEDLKLRVLRHTTPAFAEDPLRVLRVARFAARYGFRIAESTRVLMKQLVEDGELNHLTKERVMTETVKALAEEHAPVYFMHLHQVGAHKVLFPEFDFRDLSALTKACKANEPVLIRYGCLFTTIPNGKKISVALKASNEFNVLAGHVSANIETYLQFCFLTPEKILKLFEALDFYRAPQKFLNFLKVCDFQHDRFGTSNMLKTICLALLNVTTESINMDGLEGKQIGNALRNKRLEVITNILR